MALSDGLTSQQAALTTTLKTVHPQTCWMATKRSRASKTSNYA